MLQAQKAGCELPRQTSFPPGVAFSYSETRAEGETVPTEKSKIIDPDNMVIIVLLSLIAFLYSGLLLLFCGDAMNSVSRSPPRSPSQVPDTHLKRLSFKVPLLAHPLLPLPPLLTFDLAVSVRAPWNN